MKAFRSISFDARECQRELDEFGNLLRLDRLKERSTIKPFFEQRSQLSSFIGTYIPGVAASVGLLAFEWEIRGDFVVDLAVGSEKNRTFCMIEFEEGNPDSILAHSGKKSTKEWSRRFEHGFSQLIDWFFALDDLSHTQDFADDFGPGHVKFHGLLVIGRSSGVTEADRRRVRWREERVIINSHPVHCITYDELHDVLQQRLKLYAAAAISG